jgi:uncharacterized membrane protein YdjX (TVP38/TMEM64 family)
LAELKKQYKDPPCRTNSANEIRVMHRILTLMAKPSSRSILIFLWLLVMTGGWYVFLFRRDLLEGELESAASFSMIFGSILFLILGCVRGFTLIPSTALVLAGIPFFSPGLLFALTLAGILISSASIYFFSEWLRLDEVIARQHAHRLHSLQAALSKYELPVIIGWSFFPLAPTDLICYLCGVLRVDFRKFLLGIAIGEGSICASYIFLGDYLLHLLRLRV